MIDGAHVIVYSTAADADREALRALFPRSVDAGGGWPIFALPPAELAVHPTDDTPSTELYLMCDDLDATLAELAERALETVGPISEQTWGRLAAFRLPSGARISLYQPTHPRAHDAS